MEKQLNIPMPTQLTGYRLYTNDGCYCFVGWLCKYLDVEMSSPDRYGEAIDDLTNDFDFDKTILHKSMVENDEADTPEERLVAFRRNAKKLGITVIEATPTPKGTT